MKNLELEQMEVLDAGCMGATLSGTSMIWAAGAIFAGISGPLGWVAFGLASASFANSLYECS